MFLISAEYSSAIVAFQWSCYKASWMEAGSLEAVKTLGLNIPALDLVLMEWKFLDTSNTGLALVWSELDWSATMFVIEEVEGEGTDIIEEWIGIRAKWEVGVGLGIKEREVMDLVLEKGNDFSLNWTSLDM